ncbi:MAG: molybdate ABC transporter substrate-binding protein [Chloroflexi bacterium]|nr:molybdate ABC transporter substrate-binding protein [Chloroflexota bacterium]
MTVLAASSLTEVYRTIGAAFQQANPGVTVEFSFAASSALAAQIEQGVPVDVFASADEANMKKVTDRQLIAGAPVPFARNHPVIVVPAANRAGIVSPKDLAKPGAKVVLAGPEVPIGNYSRQIIDRLSADPAYGAAFKEATLKNVVSNEANVRAVLTKVELGEADAGVVYRTDAKVSGERVKILEVPAAANVIAIYPVGVVAASKNQVAAKAFVAFLVGPEGQRALQAAGFEAAR